LKRWKVRNGLVTETPSTVSHFVMDTTQPLSCSIIIDHVAVDSLVLALLTTSCLRNVRFTPLPVFLLSGFVRVTESLTIHDVLATRLAFLGRNALVNFFARIVEMTEELSIHIVPHQVAAFAFLHPGALMHGSLGSELVLSKLVLSTG